MHDDNAAPAAMTMDRNVATRTIAASCVGHWHGTGSVGACGLETWYNIHPLNANQKYVQVGFIRVKGFGFLPVSRLTYKGERDADGSVITGYTRNANKLEGEPGGGPTTYTGTLSSIDANALKATYDVQGRGPSRAVSGTIVLDGRAMTEVVERTGGQGGTFRLSSTKVSDEVQEIVACGCVNIDGPSRV